MAVNAGGALSGAASGAAAGTMVMPGIGTAIGAVVGGLAGLFTGGQKAPAQATYTPVDPNQVTANTISGNLANLNGAESLASQTNTFNQSQANSLLEQAMPGFSNLQQKLLGQVNTQLNSETTLPQDVSDKLAQTAAEQGVSRGTSGNFNGFDLVKDFGFNLVDWQNAQRTQALNTLSTVYGMTPRVSPMSPMASLLDPNTAVQVQAQNNKMQYDVAQGGANAQAAASNYNRMMTAGTLSNIGTAFGSILPDSLFKTPEPNQGYNSIYKVLKPGVDYSVGSGLSPAPASFAGK